jgi:predicted HTH transcriptional regulator
MPRSQPTNIERAERAKRETRNLDFKERFDPGDAAEWCELVKDFMAMANSGGGLIVVGVCNDGTASRADVRPILTLDPAKITDKVERYTGLQFADFEIHEAKRGRKKVAVIQVGAAREAPIVFTKPGTHPVAGDSGKQKTAFSKGTVYFRHGAKSEPATTADSVVSLSADWRRCATCGSDEFAK